MFSAQLNYFRLIELTSTEAYTDSSSDALPISWNINAGANIVDGGIASSPFSFRSSHQTYYDPCVHLST